MKKLILKLFVLFISVIGHLNAQEKPTVFIGTGTNLLKSDVNTSKFLNSDFGINGGYFTPLIKKDKFNLGLNLSGAYNFANKDFDNLESIVPIIPAAGLTTETFSNKVNQTLMRFGAGPQFNLKLGNKVWLSPILQAGYFKFNQDEILATQENTFSNNTFSNVIYSQDAVKESGFFINPALRLSYLLTKNWSIWGETNYFLANINTVQNTLIPIGTSNENGQYDWQQILESKDFTSKEVKTSLNNLGANVGIAYSFDGKKKEKQEEEEAVSDINEEPTDCSEIINLIFPKSQKELVLDDKKFPEQFTWQKASFEKARYTFNLYKGDSLVFKQETRNNYIVSKTFKDKLALSKENVKFEYKWNVTVFNPECKEYTTPSNSFGLKGISDPYLEITDVICKTPAYQIDGKVHYQVSFTIKYLSDNLQWNINTINLWAVDASGTATPIYPTFNLGLPITLSSMINVNYPQQDYSFEIAVPIGTTIIDIQANGNILNSSGVIVPHFSGNTAPVREDKIDNCICNFCDDYRISLTRNATTFFEQPAGINNDILEVRHTLNITPSNAKVVAIDVEIINYKHLDYTTEQCISCNNTKDQHGTFVNRVEGGVNESNLITGNFAPTQGIYNNPLGPSGRSVRWQSLTSLGSTVNNVQTTLAVGIPKLINSCCSDCFEMTFRYTFTFMDERTGECRKCSRIVNMRKTCRNKPRGGGVKPEKPIVLTR